MVNKIIASIGVVVSMGLASIAFQISAKPLAKSEGTDVLTETGHIKPYSKNPWYWEYRGAPILLRGGSNDDNIFQWENKSLLNHLDQLVKAGGNYIRNTMSDRDENNLYAHEKDESGLFDLWKWNDEYWERLEFFLVETSKRSVIVQLTVWDVYDLEHSKFANHPINPVNNKNWDKGLISNSSDFYSSVQNKNQLVIAYQHRYVDKLVSICFKYDNILYNINNESLQGAEWENYWAHYLKSKASENSKDIYITSMQMEPSNSVRHVMTHRNIYSFAEISQNNQDSRGGRGREHYNNIIHWRRMIESNPNGPFPMNNEKIYGSGAGSYNMGTGKEAEDRFWKNIFAGAASVRFHRPEAGIGLNEKAKSSIKSMSMFLDVFDIFSASPYVGIKMYGASEGYAMAIMGKQYAVYLPGGRYSVILDPWVFVNKVKVKFLDIDASTWLDEKIIDVKWNEELSIYFGYQNGISITSPGTRPCVALIEVTE